MAPCRLTLTRELEDLRVTSTYCPHCGRAPHPIVSILRTTERRHGTYIHAAFAVHTGHSLTIRPGLGGLTLFCNECERAIIEAGSNGRWRGEYESPRCVVPGYES